MFIKHLFREKSLYFLLKNLNEKNFFFDFLRVFCGFFYFQPWVQEPAERGDRKIIIPLNEASTSEEEEEEPSTDQESEAESRSEVLRDKDRSSLVLQTPSKSLRHYTLPRVV
jgi:hypothetical protein